MSDRKLPMSMTLVFAICAGALVSHAQTVLYVDDDAPLSGDCGDWCTAYKYLQDALSAAQAGDEIRVAEGIYKPDEDEAHPDGTGDRSATFQLISGVALHGGYRGCPGGVCGAGDDPNERDIETHETILSGDLSGDDAPNESDCCHHHSGSGCDDAGCEALVCGLDPECCSVRWDAHCVSLAHSNCAGVCGGFGENSCHVATGSGTDATAVLDGFTVAAGNADPACTERCGGGMYNYNGSPTVANCTFDGNIAQFEHGTGWGGGMYNYYASNPIVTNCTFSGNLANAGGGMYNGATSNPTVTNCTFTGNEGTNGGGMKSSYSGPMVTRCTFTGNSASGGGGMLNDLCYDQRSPTIENCVFSGNTADAGGGMVNDTSDPKVFNCVFTGNSANYDGGAVMNMRDARPTITNCTVSGNTAASSCGGVYNWLGEGNEVNVANCILWGNSDDSGTDESAQIDVLEGTALVNYSSVQGCTIFCANPDDHNIGDDPLFVRDPDPGPDGNWDGVDDDYGDLHLQAGSPCIDAGNNNADTDANTPGIQPLPPTDLDGNFRIVMVESATVDMGAYEFQDGTPIPAVSEWGLVAMTLLVLTAGTVVLMRRRRAVTAC